MNFDPSKLPKSLETAEDYEIVCRDFLMPFFYEQAKKIVDVIKELHEAIDNNELEQERIDFYINRIKELSAFANPDSPMNPYMQAVAELEAKLEKQGYFDETEPSNN